MSILLRFLPYTYISTAFENSPNAISDHFGPIACPSEGCIMMGRSWGKTVLLVATIASQSCDAFLVHSCGRVGLPKTAVWTSSAFTAGSSSCGAINTRLSSCDMSRPDSHRATSCSPLMMAKMPKTGKGKGKTKAERMEYVQRYVPREEGSP